PQDVAYISIGVRDEGIEHPQTVYLRPVSCRRPSRFGVFHPLPFVHADVIHPPGDRAALSIDATFDRHRHLLHTQQTAHLVGGDVVAVTVLEVELGRTTGRV